MLPDETLSFLAILKHGSFTQAAKARRLPKATLSRHVAQLEQHLGQRLLDRTTRTVRLTEAGRIYADHVETLPQLLAQATEAVSALHDHPSGWIRVAVSHTMANALIVPLMTQFRQLYPDVRFDLSLSHRAEDIIGRQLDVAVRLGEPADSGLMARRLTRLVNHIYAAPAYLERHGAPEAPTDIIDHATLAGRFDERHDHHLWRLGVGDAARTAFRIQPAMIADDAGSLINAAVGGAGLLMMPDIIVRDHVSAGRLVPVLPDWTGHSPSLYALMPPGRSRLAKVRLFVDYLAAHLR